MARRRCVDEFLRQSDGHPRLGELALKFVQVIAVSAKRSALSGLEIRRLSADLRLEPAGNADLHGRWWATAALVGPE